MDLARRSPRLLIAGIVIVGLLGIWLIAGPLLVTAVHREREFDAVEALAMLQTAQSEYYASQGRFGDWADLDTAGLLPGPLATGTYGNYAFDCRVSQDDPARWLGIARPLRPGAPYLVVSEAGVVYALRGPPALTDDCKIPTDAVLVDG